MFFLSYKTLFKDGGCAEKSLKLLNFSPGSLGLTSMATVDLDRIKSLDRKTKYSCQADFTMKYLNYAFYESLPRTVIMLFVIYSGFCLWIFFSFFFLSFFFFFSLSLSSRSVTKKTLKSVFSFIMPGWRGGPCRWQCRLSNNTCMPFLLLLSSPHIITDFSLPFFSVYLQPFST